MPDVDGIIALADRPAAYLTGTVRFGLVRNPDITPSPIPDPSVKRALDPVVHNTTTEGEIGTEMLAVGIEHVRYAVVAAISDQFGSEVAQGDNITDRQIGRPRDLEPSGGMHAELTHRSDLLKNWLKIFGADVKI